MNETQLVYLKMRTEIENLKNENEWNKKELELLRGNVKKIITHFWMWYVSGNHKRDFNKKEEGEKYADSFLNDLVKEVSGIE